MKTANSFSRLIKIRFRMFLGFILTAVLFSPSAFAFELGWDTLSNTVDKMKSTLGQSTVPEPSEMQQVSGTDTSQPILPTSSVTPLDVANNSSGQELNTASEQIQTLSAPFQADPSSPIKIPLLF